MYNKDSKTISQNVIIYISGLELEEIFYVFLYFPGFFFELYIYFQVFCFCFVERIPGEGERESLRQALL